jgi:PI-3-kinase-related kinase SMG-1
VQKKIQTLSTARQATEKETPNKLLRLIDLYYAKLIPALKAKGITNVMSRKDWPPDVLKRVFLELEKETPRDLLEKELWCSSATTAEWWKKVQVYSRSAAVMSIVGYVIGLGDRHLDNILIDFESGEVVHIDYNICFEKGLKLRVPEIVPFRLTQNMHRALGLTGVEGTFRITCEHVLRVLRKSRETLLTLLEAFVYDPLVDWTADRAFIEEKALDLNVSLSLFCSRIEDVKSALTENQEAFVSKLPLFVSSISTLATLQIRQQNLKREFSNKQEKLLQAKEALSKTISALSKISSFDGRVIKEKQLQEEKEAIEKLLNSAIKECAAWQQSHEKTLEKIKNFGFASFISDVKISERIPRTLASVSTNLNFLPLREDIIKKCCDLDNEMTRLLANREAVFEQCLEFLSVYRSAVLQMPPNYAQMSVAADWERLLTKLHQCQDPQQSFQEILDYVSEEKRLAISESDRQIEKTMQLEISAKSQKIQGIRASLVLMETTCAQMDIRIKQLREQLSAVVAGTNAQNKENEGSRCAQIGALLCLAEVLDQFSQKMQTASLWVWNDFANIVDQTMFILTLIRDLWVDYDAINAADIERDLLYSFQESFVPGVTQFLANFSSIVLPEIVKAVHSKDAGVLRCFQELQRLSTEAKKAKEQPESLKTKQHEKQDSSLVNGDNLWDMPTQTTEVVESSAKSTSFFGFDFPDTKLKYENLIRVDSPASPSETSPSDLNGKILLAAFDKLFRDLEQQHIELVELCKSEMTDFEEISRENVFFTQKLETMTSVISICMEGATTTSPSNSSETLLRMNAAFSRFLSCYLTELVAPIYRTLMYRFISTRYHGIQPLNKNTPLKAQIEMWVKTLSQKTANCDLILQLLSELVATKERLKATLQEKNILLSQIGPLEIELANQQKECFQFQWLREESLKYYTTFPENFVPPSYARSKLLENIAMTMKSLFSLDQALKDTNKAYCDTEDEVHKALQWYCTQKPTKIGRGAITQHQQQDQKQQTALKHFAESIKHRRQYFKLLTEKTKELTDLCKSILELETFKILPNNKNKNVKETAAGAIHQAYFQIAQRYYDCVVALNTLRKEIEESRKHFEHLTKEHKELTRLNGELNNEINKLSKEISEIQEKYDSETKKVSALLPEMDALYNSESQLINEIDSLLTNIIKITEKWESVSQIHTLASKLQKQQKTFLVEFEALMKHAHQVSDASSSKSSTEMSAQIDMSRFEERGASLLDLESKIQKDIFELYKMATEWQQQQQQQEDEDKQSDIQSSQEEVPGVKQSFQTSTEEKLDVMQHESVDVEPVEGHSDDEDAADSKDKAAHTLVPTSRTVKNTSTKNVHAMNVLRRVKAKLEGRDFAAQKAQNEKNLTTNTAEPLKLPERMSVAEQVDWVIREATSIDNLSKMYEGWTAWI